MGRFRFLRWDGPPGSLRVASAPTRSRRPLCSPLSFTLLEGLREIRMCSGEVCCHGEPIPDLQHVPWRHECAPQDAAAARASSPASQRTRDEVRLGIAACWMLMAREGTVGNQGGIPAPGLARGREAQAGPTGCVGGHRRGRHLRLHVVHATPCSLRWKTTDRRGSHAVPLLPKRPRGYAAAGGRRPSSDAMRKSLMLLCPHAAVLEAPIGGDESLVPPATSTNNPLCRASASRLPRSSGHRRGATGSPALERRERKGAALAP